MTLFAPYNPGQTERHRPLGVSWDSKETPECQLMAKARWGLRDHTSSSTALIISTSQQCIQPGPLNKVKCDPSWLQIFINTFACLDALNTTSITSQITGFNVHIFSALLVPDSSALISLVLEREAKETCLQTKAYG